MTLEPATETVRARPVGGGIAELGDLARRHGASRVLVVTDPGVVAAGILDRALAALAGLPVAVFDRVAENPTSDHVEDGRRVAAAFAPDLIVGLGGGSAMDCAKGINFVLTNGGRMEDYRGFGKASRPLLPAIGVPTTAGTGSEAQSYALISHPESHAKMACGDAKARFVEVILDPELVATTPRRVAAAAGLDAVAHAVESLVATNASADSRRLSRDAWTLLDARLPAYLDAPGNPDAAADVLLGAHLAGAAIEASMLGAAHALANPLTARWGLAHGTAVSLMLPWVVRFNAAVAGERYRELAERLPERLEELRATAGLPARLRELEVPAESFEAMAEDAAGQWTARFNPRPVGPRELLEIYREAS
jgi:alcohol dehydrogenase